MNFPRIITCLVVILVGACFRFLLRLLDFTLGSLVVIVADVVVDVVGLVIRGLGVSLLPKSLH